jgi:uncharacterized membrane protein
MSAFKLGNEYAEELGALFADVPKAVLAAIAVSALTLGGDYLDEAQQRLVTEWSALHTAGIVPQAVPGKYRHLIDHELGL